MLMRMPRFIRRWIRRTFPHMEEDDAHRWRQRLSYVYIFFAWNAGGYVIYQIFTGNKHWPVTHGLVTPQEQAMRDRPAYWFASALGIEKAEVYRMKGLNIFGVEKMASVDTRKEPETNQLIPEVEKQVTNQQQQQS